ncbi:hypothetical protein N656DRAFT_840433 [Canariomyces notabilis]|uniref:DUF7580 domain-containing protein n=1 Tax=Canariomyces notabilis TaxID=2074819 RepID=A0AAN6T7A3_9PEZI|nr:hypothetical protein N656DRAFT_840433 [Canariomyces arenarius]
MSGFEVAGVILALLPLAIKAARAYADILSSNRTAKYELTKLIQDLETEEACLQNTCELLLMGIVPHNAPFNEKMRLRLWHTHASFVKHIDEMLAATKELHKKLCVTADGEPKFMDPITILRELKKRSAFTLKKRDYDTVLDRIKAANSVLERLATQSRQLEPDRKHRSQARVTRLVRNLARGLFSALHGAATCRCAPNTQIHRTRWSQTVRFKIEKKPTVSTTQASSDCPPRIVISQTTAPARGAPRTITNLCRFVMKEHRTAVPDCCGYIADNIDGRKFGLYPRLLQQKQGPNHLRVITLRQVLEDGWQHPRPFCFLDKFEVALALSVGVLHLFDTPWLGRVITLDDVVFVQEAGEGAANRMGTAAAPAVGSKPVCASPYRPFVLKKLLVETLVNPSLTTRAPETNVNTDARVANLAILSLGILLIQVIIGKTVKALGLSENLDSSALLSKCTMGAELLGQVRGSAGTNYEMAVNWCLSNAFKVANLKKDKFCNEYYAEVVARLESDLELLADD